MNEQVPERLYHYTSINSLGFILKNKNLRFNNLTAMDDLDEAVFNGKNWGKYCFISSWTDKEEESIEMWKMYSNDMRGVRISLKTNPFKVIFRLQNGEFLMSPDDIINKPYTLVTFFQSQLLYQVKYDNDEFLKSFKDEEILKRTEDGRGEFLGNKLGIFKSKFWKFQQEWRYRLLIYPFPTPCDNPTFYLDTMADLPFTDYFLDLDEEALKDMEVLLGPKTNEIDEEIVRLLVKEYNPNALNKIHKSKLRDKIR